MEQSKDCQEIYVEIDHPYGPRLSESLSDWIESGPGMRWGLNPKTARCKDDGRKLPFSVIPMQYRNNDVSRFLFACGVMDHPWNLVGFPDDKFPIEMSSEDSIGIFAGYVDSMAGYMISAAGIFLRRDKNLTTVQIRFPLQVIDVGIVDYHVGLCRVITMGNVFISNYPLTQAEGSTLLFPQQQDGFIATLQLTRAYVNEDELERYIPDIEFASNWSSSEIDIGGRKARCILSDSEKYDCALLTLFMDVGDFFWNQVRYFAVGHRGHQQELLDTAINLLSQVEVSSTLPADV